MPELPDVTLYLTALQRRIVGATLEHVRLKSPFLLRSIEPPISELEGKEVIGLRRLGKRIVLEFGEQRFLVFHLMIAGRFQWREAGAKIPGKLGLAAFDFSSGCLLFTEAGTKKRASLYVVQGEEKLQEHQPGGVEPLEVDLSGFTAALLKENRTLKRALTDPRAFSGIGNAYSDEIFHRAGMSPVQRTKNLKPDAIERLFHATREVLQEWIDRLQEETGDDFPTKVTAFRKGMAVHGRHGKPCPVCKKPVQRIVYAERETNYCAICQTNGKLLADRALSLLLKEDWPKTLE